LLGEEGEAALEGGKMGVAFERGGLLEGGVEECILGEVGRS